MTWTRLSDGFIDDPVLLALPRGTRLLHVEGLVWSNRQGTDGDIPRHVLRRLTDEQEPEAAVATLVAAGLWMTRDDGWQIANFLRDQLPAAEVAAARDRNAKRQKRWRHHRDGDHDLCSPGTCYVVRNSVTNASPSDPSDPPVPSGTGRAEEDMDGASADLARAAVLRRRREMAADIRNASDEELRVRYLATFNRLYGHLYAQEVPS